jgi:hypothetical protein
LCTSMPIYLMSRLIFSCLLGGKVIRVNGYLSLKAKCHSSAHLPILSSASFAAGHTSIIPLITLILVKQGAPS